MDPPTWRCVALYEYLGAFPDTEAEHGNAKNSARTYVRTHADVLDHVKKTIIDSRTKPRDVYEHVTLQGHSTGDAPRDLAQVQRMAATVAADCALNKPQGSRNLADDVQK